MNIEQAKLLVKGALHVKNVGAMSSCGTSWWNPDAPVCFVCEMYRAGLVTDNELICGAPLAGIPSMSEVFGITQSERITITAGDYQNGPECYEAVKALLTKYGYGHLLDAPEEVIPIHVPQIKPVYPDQFTKAEAGFDWRNPKPVNHVAA